MSDLQAISLAMLVSIPGIGQRTASHILRLVTEKRWTWQEFWAGGVEVWKDFNFTEMQENSIKSFLTEHTIDSYSAMLVEKKIRVIDENSAEYPPLLTEIDHPPVVLFAQGNLLDWSTVVPPIAVVGTRHMTAYGKMVTQKITQELVWAGAPIISGFMYGVDICAHQTTLENQGRTVGILGFGFEYMYPKSQVKLYQAYLEKGMIFISPFAPNIQPNAGNFPARNAVVAGMSAAVVVTEAAEKSGTHITAGFAADFGRSVCAVPGSILSPYSSGTKWLVNQGAVLVSSGEEVIENCSEFGIKKGISGQENKPTTLHFANELQQKVYTLVSELGGISLDELSADSGTAVSELLQVITQLEMQQLIKKEGEKWMVYA